MSMQWLWRWLVIVGYSWVVEVYLHKGVGGVER